MLGAASVPSTAAAHCCGDPRIAHSPDSRLSAQRPQGSLQGRSSTSNDAMILSALRTATREQHLRVERAVNLPARLRSRASFGSLLERFYGYYSPLEERLTALARAGQVPFDLQPRLKTTLLRQDLLALGRTPEQIATLPLCTELPSLRETADAMGCLYVLEGATLGGQIIRQAVSRQLGIEPDSGCAFFHSYGSRTHSQWSNFCSILADYGDRHPGAESQVITAATETFARLGSWIEGQPVTC